MDKIASCICDCIKSAPLACSHVNIVNNASPKSPPNTPRISSDDRPSVQEKCWYATRTCFKFYNIRGNHRKIAKWTICCIGFPHWMDGMSIIMHRKCMYNNEKEAPHKNDCSRRTSCCSYYLWLVAFTVSQIMHGVRTWGSPICFLKLIASKTLAPSGNTPGRDGAGLIET